ncbi:hypothetical protein V8C40DRAFT_251276 [Trichoderma camerunense]
MAEQPPGRNNRPVIPPRRLELSNIPIDKSDRQYGHAVLIVEGYWKHAMTMTPKEQDEYISLLNSKAYNAPSKENPLPEDYHLYFLYGFSGGSWPIFVMLTSMFGEIKSLNGPSGRTITNLTNEYRRYHRDPDRPKNRSSIIPQKREYDDASLHQSKATSTAEAVAPSSTTDGTTPVDKTHGKRQLKMNDAKSSTTIDLTNNAPTITAIDGTKLPEISKPKATQLPNIESISKAGRLLGLEEKIDRLLGLEGKIDRLIALGGKIDRLLQLESKIDRLIALGGKIEGPQGLEGKINKLAELGPRVETLLNTLDMLVGIEDL